MIETPRTFLASSSCVVHAGAIPVFAHVDANIDGITWAKIDAVSMRRAKAVIPVLLAADVSLEVLAMWSR